jgi:glycosyltransferase involved in cell wall biosynthesis
MRHEHQQPTVKVFLAATSLRPAYGGPAYSVSRLAVALTQAGIKVGLWAADQSAATTPLLSNDSSVQRVTGSAREALNSFGKIDVLHDNGIWLLHNHRLARLAAERRIPRVVSTRGMLEPWAMNHKRLKKQIAWWLYQRRDLNRACCHHTTSEAEASNVERLGLGVPVRVIPNGVDMPQFSPGEGRFDGKEIRTGEKKTALFLGRIYRVKGLPLLVEAWARVRPSGWRLQIAGPDEAGHRAEVENAVCAAHLDEVISFVGPLDGEAKRSALSEADLFVLPTYSESFGMAIAEALAYGLPVLTTTGAPWPMLPKQGCGWWVDPTVDGIAEGLRQATPLDSATLRSMGARGRELAVAEFAWGRVVNQFVSIYEDLLRSGRPDGASQKHVKLAQQSTQIS